MKDNNTHKLINTLSSQPGVPSKYKASGKSSANPKNIHLADKLQPDVLKLICDELENEREPDEIEFTANVLTCLTHVANEKRLNATLSRHELDKKKEKKYSLSSDPTFNRNRCKAGARIAFKRLEHRLNPSVDEVDSTLVSTPNGLAICKRYEGVVRYTTEEYMSVNIFVTNGGKGVARKNSEQEEEHIPIKAEGES